MVDTAKHGLRLATARHGAGRPDLLVDSHDPARAVAVARANLRGRLRFGLDTRGRETAGCLMQALAQEQPPQQQQQQQQQPQGEGQGNGTDAPSPLPGTPGKDDDNSAVSNGRPAEKSMSAHLVGLTGLPKEAAPEGVVFHTVPIKLFHEVPAVGEALVGWLERLLAKGLVKPPEIIDVEHGLGSVNRGLDRMRRGEISGGKLVVRVD